MRRTVLTLAHSADITVSFTPPGLDGLCIMIKNLLGQLEADAPAASSDTEERITGLVRLLQRASNPSGHGKDGEKLEGAPRTVHRRTGPRFRAGTGTLVYRELPGQGREGSGPRKGPGRARK